MKPFHIPKPIEHKNTVANHQELENNDSQKNVHISLKGHISQNYEKFMNEHLNAFNNQERSGRLSMQFNLIQNRVSVSPIDRYKLNQQDQQSKTQLSDQFTTNIMANSHFPSIKSPSQLSVDRTLHPEVIIPKNIRFKNSGISTNMSEKSQYRLIQNTFSYSQSVKTTEEGSDRDKVNSETSRVTMEIETHKSKPSFSLMNFRILKSEAYSNGNNMQRFVPVYQFLKELFKGVVNGRDIDVANSALSITIQNVINKKFNINIPINPISIEKIEFLISNEIFNRRPEECKKMVLGYAIKQLKRRLRDSLSCKYRKNGFDEFFYHHYFNEASQREGLPLQDFFYPIVSEKKKTGSARTINKTYINNIKKSEIFIIDLEIYLNQHFTEDYSKEIDSKLFDLISKLEVAYSGTTSIEHWKETMQAQLGLSKSKLPWTIFEIRSAIDKVKKIIY